MKNNFQQTKLNALAKADKSSKNSFDKKISNLCEKLNKSREYYTTSSCAGRILLIQREERKMPGLFLFVTHDKTSLKELKAEMGKIARKSKRLIYFKQEPCILHIACQSLSAAQKLLEWAKLSGWKKLGIIALRRRIVVEISSTEKIEMPIINKGKILVSDDFLKLLVKDANSLLERSWEKIKRLKKFV